MEQPCEVPLCPPGQENAMAKHLRVTGWRWDEELLLLVVAHLANEDVCETRALVGLDLDDVPDSAGWPPEVRTFMQTAIQQAACIQKCVTVRPTQGLPPAAKRPRTAEALELVNMPTLLLNVQRTRPLEALELLRRNLPSDEASLAQWRQGARVAAVMGSCPRSMDSFKSGENYACARVLHTTSGVHRPQALDKIHRNHAW